MTPRELAQLRQCTYRRGEPAGCPCAHPDECRVPPLELAVKVMEERKAEKAKFEAFKERMRASREARERKE